MDIYRDRETDVINRVCLCSYKHNAYSTITIIVNVRVCAIIVRRAPQSRASPANTFFHIFFLFIYFPTYLMVYILGMHNPFRSARLILARS